MPSLVVTIFWALSGVSQACYRELPAGITNCAAPNGSFQHEFSGLKWNTLYAFTYRTKDGESEPLPYLTPQQPPAAQTSDWQDKYQACSLSNFQLNELIGRLRKTCARKCDKVR